jgi:hypothetical protein
MFERRGKAHEQSSAGGYGVLSGMRVSHLLHSFPPHVAHPTLPTTTRLEMGPPTSPSPCLLEGRGGPHAALATAQGKFKALEQVSRASEAAAAAEQDARASRSTSRRRRVVAPREPAASTSPATSSRAGCGPADEAVVAHRAATRGAGARAAYPPRERGWRAGQHAVPLCRRRVASSLGFVHDPANLKGASRRPSWRIKLENGEQISGGVGVK